MQERARLDYLKAMGITNYMPRWQLPNAPEAQLTAFLPPAEPVPADPSTEPQAIPAELPQPLQSIERSTERDAATEAPAPVESPAPLRADFASVAPIEPAPKPEQRDRQPSPEIQPQIPSNAPAALLKTTSKPSKEAKTPVSAQNSAPLVKFALSFWRVSEDLLVVDSRHSELALPTEKLLTNIVFALGYPRELPKSEVVQWPLIDAHHQDQGEAAARETLNAFLDAQFLLNPGKYLLLMGQEASHFILDTGKPYADMLGHHFPVEEFNLTAFVVPSLSETLQEPAQKRLIWDTIKPLRHH